MLKAITHWFASAAILYLVAYLMPGIAISSFVTALVAALVLGVVNMVIRPVLNFLSFPINFLTVGLFSFVVNALMFALAAWLVPGFEVSNFIAAIFGAMLLGVFTSLVERLFEGKAEQTAL